MAMLAEFPNLKSHVPDIDLDNLDELLGKLTAEELDELNGDFDPDVRDLVTVLKSCQHHHKKSLKIPKGQS